jgi:ankyrin repeat protein
VVLYLVNKLGAYVDQPSSDNSTPLYAAAHYGHVDMVRCMVKHLGADVHLGDEEGNGARR